MDYKDKLTLEMAWLHKQEIKIYWAYVTHGLITVYTKLYTL